MYIYTVPAANTKTLELRVSVRLAINVSTSSLSCLVSRFSPSVKRATAENRNRRKRRKRGEGGKYSGEGDQSICIHSIVNKRTVCT